MQTTAMPNLSDSNPSKLLNQTINSFNTVHLLWQLKRSLSMAVVLPLCTLPTHWYTFPLHNNFLHIVQTLFCESRRVLTLWPQMTVCYSTMVQSNSRAVMFTLQLQKLHWMEWLSQNMSRLSSVCSMHDVHKSTVWQITRILHANCSYFLNSLCINETKCNIQSLWVEIYKALHNGTYSGFFWNTYITFTILLLLCFVAVYTFHFIIWYNIDTFVLSLVLFLLSFQYWDSSHCHCICYN